MNPNLNNPFESELISGLHGQNTERVQQAELNTTTSFDLSTPVGGQANPTLIPDDNNIPSSFAPQKQKLRKPRGRAVNWSAEMTTILVRELVQAVREGKRSDNGFKIEVWNAISDTVRANAGKDVPLTGEKCQAKLEGLKKKWKVWTRLKKMSGFGFDPLTGTITAPDEVWEMEIQRQPSIREFRDRPLGNLSELGELFEGVQATGRHAIYPGSNDAQSNGIFSPSPNTPLIDSDNTDFTTTTHSRKRARAEEDLPSTPLGRVRQRLDAPAVRLVNAAEKMIAAPIPLPTITSAIQQAVAKLRENYRGKVGWSTQDILKGYKLFENTVKADIFVALDGGEDEEMWLRDQLQAM